MNMAELRRSAKIGELLRKIPVIIRIAKVYKLQHYDGLHEWLRTVGRKRKFFEKQKVKAVWQEHPTRGVTN